MFVLSDPFFWAFVGMFGLLAGTVAVGGAKLGRSPAAGFVIVMVTDLSRIVLVLPLCPQPRFEIGHWNWVVGGALLLAAVVFAVPAMSIKPWTAPDRDTVLKTTGIYGVVRNPIYFADVVSTLGFAVMFCSIIGVALVPLWWIGFLLLISVEEGSLERVLGRSYLDYKRRVKGRIIPGLPI